MANRPMSTVIFVLFEYVVVEVRSFPEISIYSELNITSRLLSTATSNRPQITTFTFANSFSEIINKF